VADRERVWVAGQKQWLRRQSCLQEFPQLSEPAEAARRVVVRVPEAIAARHLQAGWLCAVEM